MGRTSSAHESASGGHSGTSWVQGCPGLSVWRAPLRRPAPWAPAGMIPCYDPAEPSSCNHQPGWVGSTSGSSCVGWRLCTCHCVYFPSFSTQHRNPSLSDMLRAAEAQKLLYLLLRAPPCIALGAHPPAQGASPRRAVQRKKTIPQAERPKGPCLLKHGGNWGGIGVLRTQ